MSWYVYLLECSDGTLYTGITNDLKRRIKQHNEGKGAKYTRGRIPIKLIGIKKVDDRSKALKYELLVKQQNRQNKIYMFDIKIDDTER